MKKKFKSIIAFFLCVAVLLTAASCGGTLIPGTGGSISGNTDNGSSGGTIGTTEEPFTVSLDCEEKFTSVELAEMKAIWTDLNSNNGASFTASFNSEGIAEKSGLDGDYMVTLSSVPDGYTYNPNDEEHKVSNDSPDVKIKLYKLTDVPGGRKGTDWYDDICAISSLGAYRVTLTADNFEDGVRFRYEPTVQGEYTIESYVDITQNKINPLLDMHNGSSQFVQEEIKETKDDGGSSNTYTKNFRWNLTISSSNIGNVFNFRIYATTLDKGAFPINVDFILDRDGDFTGADRDSWIKQYATHDFEGAKATAFDSKYTTGTFKYYAWYGNNNGLLDGSYIQLIEEDGFSYYYIVDEDRNFKTRLYAKITQDCEVVSSGESDDVTGSGFGGMKSIFLTEYDETTKQTNRYNYGTFIGLSGYTFDKAYGNYCNESDGVYPVTEELKVFLQRYSKSKRLFNDGNGNAEGRYDGNGNYEQFYSSSDSNQWLFACGYYA